MHIVIAVIGALAAAAFWWYRLKMMREAAGDVADAVGKVQGQLRRNKLRKKSALAPIEAIDDPVVAATTVILAIAAEDAAVSDAMEQRLREEVAPIAGTEKHLDESVVYAKWATNQVADVQTVIDKTAAFLKPKLSAQEKEQLVAMVYAATPEAERHAMFNMHTLQLKRKLGLEVNA